MISFVARLSPEEEFSEHVVFSPAFFFFLPSLISVWQRPVEEAFLKENDLPFI